MLRTDEALEKMMLRTDEALEKIREVLDRYSLSYHIQDLLTESFKLELTPSGIIVYFNESNQTWGMIDGDSGFNFLTLDGITNAIYRALWLELFRIRQLMLCGGMVLQGITGKVLVLTGTSEDGTAYTYMPEGDETGITVTVSKEAMHASEVLCVTDPASKREMDTYISYKQGVPSVHIDDNFYCYIASVFYKNKVSVFKSNPRSFTFKFDDLTAVCELDFDSTVFNVVSIDGVECDVRFELSSLFHFNTLYTKCKALSEEINPVTDEFKAIIDAIVSDLHSMLHIPLRVDKYNPGHITYLNSDMDDDYSFMVYKSEQSPDVYVLDILDVGFGESDVTIEYKAVDGKPVRLLDYTSYMAIVQTFFDDFVEVYCKDTGVFRFTFVDDYADLVDVIAQVNFETGVYTLIGVGFTPVRKEVNLQRGMFDFETLYKYCASLDRSSTGQSTQQEFDEFKEDTLPASFDLQVITFQGKPLGIHVVGDNYIYSISLEKANQLGFPVYRLTNTIEVTSHRGMLLSPTEIERKTFAVDITGDEDLCKSIIDAFWD